MSAGLFVLTSATGLFFATTGYRKLFVPEAHLQVTALFDHLRVPPFVQWMVMTGEFVGGIALMFGILTHLAAAGLLVIMLGAYVLEVWPQVRAKATGTKLLSNALCTPEAQLIIVLTAVLLLVLEV